MARAKPQPSSGTPENDLAGLMRTRENLQARQAALAADVEQAVANRRKLLIEDGDAKAIAEAELACREIEGTNYGITDALAEIERRIGDMQTQIEAARVDAERERVAAGLERNALEIQTAAVSLTKAIGEVAKAHAMLAITINGASAGQFDPHNGVATPHEIANSLTIRGFAKTMAGIEIKAETKAWSVYSLPHLVEGADPVEIAGEFGGRLRDLAGRIRAGDADFDLPTSQEAMPDFSPDNPETEIYVITPFHYVNAQREPTLVSTHRTHVPIPVANRAIELGLAADSPTREWQKAHQSHGSASATTSQYTWGDAVDINLDLYTDRQAEMARRRSAWLAERDLAA
ncbi:hypothetical protein FPV16_25565 [Methylobacterium sp. W2]|uniref:hypothetical protein n=1 Tax=Methylobacterium sp. W2 TaxID=2598107 RepID=UPI001D0C6CBB|nr:hypothetical protein [Methylobacterium sp. W2]MCC0809527.1 hypothetical protein [Methylobacterium sp. W2]